MTARTRTALTAAGLTALAALASIGPAAAAPPGVGGAIAGAWDRPGVGENLGNPITPELDALDGGKYQRFELNGGGIWWHWTVDAHAVYGAIEDRWAAIGFEHVTGYPITDELPNPDDVGRRNNFEGGWSIYWSPATGAHSVHGGIGTVWGEMGWEQSPAGYPISEEFQADGRTYQIFENGYFYWSPVEGTVYRSENWVPEGIPLR